MSYTTVIVLFGMLFMIYGFLSGKFSYGLVAITCCTFYVVTGVTDISTAFGNMSNGLIVLMAAMYVLGDALCRTRLIRKVQNTISMMEGKQGSILVFTVVAVAFIIAQVLPGTAIMAMMVPFLAGIKNTGGVSTSKMLLPILVTVTTMNCILPVGLGATNAMYMNVLLQGFGVTDKTFGLFDYFLVLMPGFTVAVILALLFMKKFPDTQLNASGIKKDQAEEEAPLYTKAQDNLIYAIFVVAFLVLMLNEFLPSADMMYIVPVVGVLILGFTKIMTLADIRAVATSSIMWMLVGVMGIANVVSATGTDQVIGNAVLTLLGGTRNPWIIMVVLSLATLLMTSFLSNVGTGAVMTPIAISVALAAGMDPRAFLLIANSICNLSFCFPSANPSTAIAFAAGGWNPIKIAKYTIPLVLIADAVVIVVVGLRFPPLG